MIKTPLGQGEWGEYQDLVDTMSKKFLEDYDGILFGQQVRRDPL